MRVFGARIVVLAIAKAINDKFGTSDTRNAAIGRSKRMGLSGPDPAEKRLERAPKAESAAPKLSKKPKRSKTVLVPEAPGLAPPLAVEPVKLALYRHPPAAGSLIELKPGDFAIPMAATRTASPSCFAAIRGGTARATARLHFRLTQGPGTASERAAGRILLRLVEAA
jgi:GcrA cell cycle regulator